MRKYEVMPQVVIYKDFFDKESLDRFYKISTEYGKMSEDLEVVDEERSTREDNHGTYPIESDDNYPINQWVPWYRFGQKTIFNYKTNFEDKNEDVVFMYEFRKRVYEVIDIVLKDYIKDWSDSGYWPDYIDDWSLGEGKKLNFSAIEILKHNIYPEKNLAIIFHTDSHKHRIGEPRHQQIITITMYINDEYTGGEVEFLNEIVDEPTVMTYKPQAGDVTVFPAGIPYWHSAKAVKSGNEKLFIRLFALWNYPGSKEWFDGIKEHGEEKWLELVDSEMQEKVSSGMYDREVRIEGTDWHKAENSFKINVKSENHTYVDGKDI